MKYITYWRFMRYLFNIDFTFICQLSFKSFSKDWINWFLPCMQMINWGDTCSHNQFHSLYWIMTLSGWIKIHSHTCLRLSMPLKNRKRRTIPYWKGNICKIDASINNKSAYISNHCMQYFPILFQFLRVFKFKATKYICFWASIMII